MSEMEKTKIAVFGGDRDITGWPDNVEVQLYLANDPRRKQLTRSILENRHDVVVVLVRWCSHSQYSALKATTTGRCAFVAWPKGVSSLLTAMRTNTLPGVKLAVLPTAPPVTAPVVDQSANPPSTTGCGLLICTDVSRPASRCGDVLDGHTQLCFPCRAKTTTKGRPARSDLDVVTPQPLRSITPQSRQPAPFGQVRQVLASALPAPASTTPAPSSSPKQWESWGTPALPLTPTVWAMWEVLRDDPHAFWSVDDLLTITNNTETAHDRKRLENLLAAIDTVRVEDADPKRYKYVPFAPAPTPAPTPTPEETSMAASKPNQPISTPSTSTYLVVKDGKVLLESATRDAALAAMLPGASLWRSVKVAVKYEVEE